MDNRKLSAGERLTGGLLGENPLLRLGLGLCPALAVTATARVALGMGVATACVLLVTAIVMGLIGGAISGKGRVPVTLVVSAALATVAQMILMGWFPELSAALGVFAPLIAVNSLILLGGGRTADNGVGAAIADGLGMGLGYVAAMTLVGAIRELLGKGSVFGAAVLPASFQPVVLASLPAGGLIIVGVCMGIFRALRRGKEGA